MAIRFSEDKKIEEQQLSYLGLPKAKAVKARMPGDTASEAEEEPTPKKKGSALPLLVGAAAVVFLMAKK